jgi:hypothetical protein
MQNFEDLGKELERRGKTEQLKALAETEDVKKLGKMLDADELERAAKAGDSQALKNILSSVLNTGEGQRLAQSLKEMMDE